MGTRGAIGTPGGYIRREILAPFWLTLFGIAALLVVMDVLIWWFVRPRGRVIPVWEFVVADLLVLPIAVIYHRKLIRQVRARLRSWTVGRKGELVVARVLRPLLDEGYEILHDLDVGRGNLDHVVIGPTGVCLIETKAWRRRVYLKPGRRLTCGGFDRTRAKNRTVTEAMALGRSLAEGGWTPYVSAAIALTKTTLPLGPIDLGSVTVLEAPDLCDWIRGRRASLADEQIRRIRDALSPLTRG